MSEHSPQMKKAVALMYDRERDNAPRIVAAGNGYVAEQILALAQKNNIPMHKDQILAETLLNFQVNTEIPPVLYKAVAEVLALVYKLDKTYKK